MKNKKKGIAIPTVVVLMSVIVAFSLLLINLVVGAQISTKAQAMELEKQITISQMKLDFAQNGTLIGTYSQSFEIFENEQNQNQKALVVKKSNQSDFDLYFLFIYDFEQNKVLANQTANFAISEKQIGEKTYYYLADIIKYKEK